MNTGGLTGYLEDRYSGTSTEISMFDSSSYDFTVTTDPGSSAANRFYLVFKKVQGPTDPPVTDGHSITVAPNPVNGLLNLLFRNQPTGNYKIQLVNTLGQVVYTNTTTVTENSQKRSFFLNIAPGNYLLNIMGPGNKQSQQVLVR